MWALIQLGCFLLLGCAQTAIIDTKPAVSDAAEYVFPSISHNYDSIQSDIPLRKRADLDQQERFTITASDDKSVLIWDLSSGNMLKRLRLPAVESHIGKALQWRYHWTANRLQSGDRPLNINRK